MCIELLISGNESLICRRLEDTDEDARSQAVISVVRLIAGLCTQILQHFLSKCDAKWKYIILNFFTFTFKFTIMC